MSTQQQTDDYGTETFVDPSDDEAVARLFNFPLAVRGSLPADLKASYAKLYSAHQRVLVQLATTKSEISTVKRENTTLHQRYQQAMDQAEQLLIVLKGLKDEKEHEWKSDSEVGRTLFDDDCLPANDQYTDCLFVC